MANPLLLLRRDWLWMASTSAAIAAETTIPTQNSAFPAQPSALVNEFVGAAHSKPKRVRELLDQRPALVNAGWDWGFGDWETPLGAASHVGNHEIAEMLLTAGAPPTLFSAAMLGQLDTLKTMVATRPGVQKTLGPHGIPLLAHAKAGGAKEIVDYIETLGGASGTAPKTLSQEDKEKLVGIYEFGPGATDKIEITVPKNQLTFTRMGSGSARPIHYLGEGEFYPAGARAVRIRVDGKTLTVHDGELIITAKVSSR